MSFSAVNLTKIDLPITFDKLKFTAIHKLFNVKIILWKEFVTHQILAELLLR